MASQMIGYRQTEQHYYPHVVKGKQFLSVLRGRTLDNNKSHSLSNGVEPVKRAIHLVYTTQNQYAP